MTGRRFPSGIHFFVKIGKFGVPHFREFATDIYAARHNFVCFFCVCWEIWTKRKIRVPNEIRTPDFTDTGRLLDRGTYGKLRSLLAWFRCACVQTTAMMSNVQNAHINNES